MVPRSDGITQFDENAMASMSALRQPVLTAVVQFITDLGSYRPVTGLSIVLALVLAYRTRRLLEPVVLLVAVEAGSSLVEVIKIATHRARPPLDGMLGAPVFDYSFPSGHTGSSTVLYILGALLLARTETRNALRRPVVAAGCVLGFLIGLSRVYLGYHWLTDVVGAWLLALVLTSIGMAFIAAHPRPDLGAILPDMVAPREAPPRMPALASGADRMGRLVRRWSVGEPDSMVPATHLPQRLHHGLVERPAADREAQHDPEPRDRVLHR
jgi:membrane-associated phospholipid phosphatase